MDLVKGGYAWGELDAPVDIDPGWGLTIMTPEFLKYLVGPLCIAGIASTLLANRELHKMQSDSPQLLREVGIERIDWWLRCIAGVYRLAFGDQRRRLSLKRRLIFSVLCIA